MISIGSTLSGLDNAVDINEHQDLVLFVGQNPSKKQTSNSSTFSRLNSWTKSMGVEVYGFINSCEKTGSVKISDVDLDNLKKACYNAYKVVALGNFASSALGLAGINHFKLPHPSPLNRQINDPDYINGKLNECRNYIFS